MITRPILAGSTRTTRVRWGHRGIDSLRVAFLHTCYRITDIDRSVAFYSALGFEEIRRAPIRDEAINVFMNQPGDGDEPRLELTYNFGVSSYELGTAYGHIAIRASDLDAMLAGLAELGIAPERPPYTIREGSSRICFVRDPDGYRCELIERPAR
jgi:lactoylglutathione lyase